jgi:hypothetical protein
MLPSTDSFGAYQRICIYACTLVCIMHTKHGGYSCVKDLVSTAAVRYRRMRYAQLIVNESGGVRPSLRLNPVCVCRAKQFFFVSFLSVLDALA